MSINVAKWTFLFVSLCFENNLLFNLDLFQLPCWNRFELLPFLVHCCSWIRYFHRFWQRNKLVNKIVMGHPSKSFTCNVIFMFNLVEKEGATRCPVASTLQAYFVFGTLLEASSLASVTRELLGLPVPFLHGIVSSIGLSNFLLAC